MDWLSTEDARECFAEGGVFGLREDMLADRGPGFDLRMNEAYACVHRRHGIWFATGRYRYREAGSSWGLLLFFFGCSLGRTARMGWDGWSLESCRRLDIQVKMINMFLCTGRR